MDAGLFTKMLSDKSVTDLKKLKYKYPQADLAEFVSLLKGSFYHALPLKDFDGGQMVYLESVAQVRLSAARVLLTPQDSSQPYGIKAMEEEKKIRKMGAVLRHREVGFSSNVLVAWKVDPERLDEVAKQMAASPSVSHCYDRTTAPDWPYNLYTMVHGHSREECERIVAGLAAETGVGRRFR